MNLKINLRLPTKSNIQYSKECHYLHYYRNLLIFYKNAINVMQSERLPLNLKSFFFLFPFSHASKQLSMCQCHVKKQFQDCKHAEF